VAQDEGGPGKLNCLVNQRAIGVAAKKATLTTVGLGQGNNGGALFACAIAAGRILRRGRHAEPVRSRQQPVDEAHGLVVTRAWWEVRGARKSSRGS
jgi:hypothetical protein